MSLAPKTALQPLDGVVFHNIPGYSGISSYNYISSSLFTITSFAGSKGAGFTDVALIYTPSNPELFLTNVGTTDLPIDRLVVETTYDFDPNTIPPPLRDPIAYSTMTHTLLGDANSGNGTTTPHLVVPEPASLGLVAIGLASAAALARRRRGVAGGPGGIPGTRPSREGRMQPA